VPRRVQKPERQLLFANAVAALRHGGHGSSPFIASRTIRPGSARFDAVA